MPAEENGDRIPHLTAEAIRQKNQIRAVVLFASAILLGCLVLIPGESLWNWAHDAIIGIVWQLGAAVAGADDLCGGYHRHGKAPRLYQRQGMDDCGGDCAVLHHGFVFGGREIPDGLSFGNT